MTLEWLYRRHMPLSPRVQDVVANLMFPQDPAANPFMLVAKPNPRWLKKQREVFAVNLHHPIHDDPAEKSYTAAEALAAAEIVPADKPTRQLQKFRAKHRAKLPPQLRFQRRPG